MRRQLAKSYSTLLCLVEFCYPRSFSIKKTILFFTLKKYIIRFQNTGSTNKSKHRRHFRILAKMKNSVRYFVNINKLFLNVFTRNMCVVHL